MDLEKDIKKCQSESNTIRSDDGFFLGINSDSAAKLCESISMESLPNNVILGTPEFVKMERENQSAKERKSSVVVDNPFLLSKKWNEEGKSKKVVVGCTVSKNNHLDNK